jgi:lipocalin
MRRIASILLIAIAICSSANGQNKQPMKTASNVSLEKYMGTWYEIARFPHSFERNLVGVTATYSLKKNGNVRVVNQGYKNSLNGKLSIAKAFAKIPDANEPGRLKVFFFWPFGADYLILDLDKEYRWVLVGSSSPNFLWILSRTPQMPEKDYENLINKAKDLGYDTNRLELVEQKK